MERLCLLVVVTLENASGEPIQTNRVADEEHRAGARNRGAGESTSSILKSPFASSGTPLRFELRSVNGAAASQISVANTRCPVALPILLPPPNTSPSPSTLICP